MATRKVESKADKDTPTHIVGLGASAGGPDALERFFAQVPEKTGVAFVVVQHLSPEHRSWLREVLARVTHLPVRVAEDGMLVQRDTVTLIPPAQLLRISAGRLQLLPCPSGSLALPVDVFFQSLAGDQGDRAVAVVLSGAGFLDLADGTRGVRAIKEAGGLVMVQSEDTAHFVSMPHSAIATGLADFVLAPEAMPDVLLRVLAGEKGAEVPQLGAKDTRVQLGLILEMLERQVGIDFSQYKSSTVLRRIERRMSIQQVTTLSEYVRRATESESEVLALSRDLLISVTRFFRDPDAFDVLKNHVIPRIVEGTPPNEPVRVWIPACATGEEAYTVAMLFLEYRDTFKRSFELKIFGTDVDRDAIAVASAATYPASVVADIGLARLERFFVRTGSGWQANRLLRQVVIFAPHNVMQDPPFTRMDLICCRNLLIYLEPAAQRRLLHVFHFALRPSRYLFLGSSETTGELAEQFKAVDGRWKIFQRSAEARMAGEPMSLRVPVRRLADSRALPLGARESDMTLVELARTVIISEFVPLALLMNESYELLHVLGDPGGLLHHSTGDASLNVQKLLPRPLAAVLSPATHKALHSGEEVIYRNVRLRRSGASLQCNLRVRPLLDPTGSRALLVMVETTLRGSRGVPGTEGSPADEGTESSTQAEQRMTDLHQELQHTKESLQATIAEREIANEELQAANEELIAANEELQSTNEELQSGNEELYTVNAEYQSKIQELSELNADVDNLLRYSDIAAIFLDPELAVRRFTPSVATLVNLMPRDIGRSIRHISMNFDARDFIEQIGRVQLDRQTIERDVVTHEGRSFRLRILPYVTEGSGAKGVVITFQDLPSTGSIDERLRAGLDVLPDPIAILDVSAHIGFANTAWIGEGLALAGEDFLGVLRAHAVREEMLRAIAEVCEGHRETAPPATWHGRRLHVSTLATRRGGALVRLGAHV